MESLLHILGICSDNMSHLDLIDSLFLFSANYYLIKSLIKEKLNVKKT